MPDQWWTTYLVDYILTSSAWQLSQSALLCAGALMAMALGDQNHLTRTLTLMTWTKTLKTLRMQKDEDEEPAAVPLYASFSCRSGRPLLLCQ